MAKKARRQPRRAKQNDEGDGNESGSDTSSMVSDASARSNVGVEVMQCDRLNNVSETTEENSQQQELGDCVENASDKSVNVRSKAYKKLESLLCDPSFSYFIRNKSFGLMSSCERSLKKGTPKEQILALSVMECLSVQLCGLTSTSSTKNVLRTDDNISFTIFDMTTQSKSLLSTLICDHSVSRAVRSRSAYTLAFLMFLCSNCSSSDASYFDVQTALDETIHIIASSLFTTSNSGGRSTEKRDKTGVVKVNKAHFQSSDAAHDVDALNGWSLLLTMIPEQKSFDYYKRYHPLLCGMLDSNNVELRIIGGEAVSILFEASPDDFFTDFCGQENINVDQCENDIIGKLRLLAKDSQRFRSKKDKKEQRSVFRSVIESIDSSAKMSGFTGGLSSGSSEEEEMPPQSFAVDGNEDFINDFNGQQSYNSGIYERYAISENQTLTIENWSVRKMYDCVKKVVRRNMNDQLKLNMTLRNIFDLDMAHDVDLSSAGQSKQEKVSLKSERASQQWKQKRSKQRDKRFVG